MTKNNYNIVDIKNRLKMLKNQKYNINYIKKIIICQSIFRKKLAQKNNIYKLFKKNQKHFEKVINGYHIINKAPIKEAVWEEINCEIAESICNISDEAMGNHKSGKDIKINNFNISNKSCKLDGNCISLSSYRLTSVCTNKNINNKENIIKEIYKRDESFDYYSILMRDESIYPNIKYMWYMIPKDYYIFKITDLKHKIGKIGNNKGNIVVWESKYCDITFSMSSQLWYKFNIDLIKKYKISEVTVCNNKPKIKYSRLFDIITTLNLS